MTDPSVVCDAKPSKGEVGAGVTQALDELAELRAQQDSLRLKREELRASVLTDAQRKMLADIDLEMNPLFDAVAERTKIVEEAVRALTIVLGKTVNGTHLMAVYSKGRDSWDSKTLMRLAKDHPVIWDAHTQGEPSVSIRKR